MSVNLSLISVPPQKNKVRHRNDTPYYIYFLQLPNPGMEEADVLLVVLDLLNVSIDDSDSSDVDDVLNTALRVGEVDRLV